MASFGDNLRATLKAQSYTDKEKTQIKVSQIINNNNKFIDDIIQAGMKELTDAVDRGRNNKTVMFSMDKICYTDTGFVWARKLVYEEIINRFKNNGLIVNLFPEPEFDQKTIYVMNISL